MIETLFSAFNADARILSITLIEPALIAALFISAGLFAKQTRWAWLWASVFTVFIYNISLSGFYSLIETPAWLQEITQHARTWFTFGLLFIVASLIGGIARVFSNETIGMTLRRTPGSLKQTMMITACVVVLLTMTAIFNVFQVEDPTATGKILYSATLQPFSEEFAFRGVLLLLLNEAFGRQRKVFGVTVGLGLALEAVAFGLFHLIGWNEGQVTFDVLFFAWTFAGGLVFVWLRERSGSLFLPFFIHAYGNTLAYLI